LQVFDAEQRDFLVHFLGVGDEFLGAAVAHAGIEHRIDTITASRTQHRADVLR
jgi:hypothetical protein